MALLVLSFAAAPGDCAGSAPAERGLFVSVIQDSPVLENREEILRLVDFAQRSGIGTLFVQVYRSNQAWFESAVGDSGPYRRAVGRVGEDPFALLIRRAHASGIRVHAWMNLLSMGANDRAPLLKKYGSGILTRNLGPKNGVHSYRIDNQYFLEPGDFRVRRELLKLTGEVVRAYPELDGIQFDYIRYPDSKPFYGYGRLNAGRFRHSSGTAAIRNRDPAWKRWKRTQVTVLLSLLVQKARRIRPGIAVSATGCAPVVRALEEAYQDWPSWVNTGLVDFVTVMAYPRDPAVFERYVSSSFRQVHDPSRLRIGVGAYKLVDDPAGFGRQFDFCEKSGCGACTVFHYGSLLKNEALKSALATGSGPAGTPFADNLAYVS